MTRVKGGTTKIVRRKKILKAAKGYFGSKHRLYRTAKEQLMHSRMYAFRDRKQRKREFRKLWITRINAACRLNNISYSRFIEGLTKAGVLINRKMLSEIAIADPKAFTNLVETSKNGLEGNIKEIKKVVKEENIVDTGDISNLSVAELKAMAKEKGIAGYSKLKKDDLINALK